LLEASLEDAARAEAGFFLRAFAIPRRRSSRVAIELTDPRDSGTSRCELTDPLDTRYSQSEIERRRHESKKRFRKTFFGGFRAQQTLLCKNSLSNDSMHGPYLLILAFCLATTAQIGVYSGAAFDALTFDANAFDACL
jgi:hypothetical protein